MGLLREADKIESHEQRLRSDREIEAVYQIWLFFLEAGETAVASLNIHPQPHIEIHHEHTDSTFVAYLRHNDRHLQKDEKRNSGVVKEAKQIRPRIGIVFGGDRGTVTLFMNKGR
jgi:hypothetical protein